jgi:hypothetical protein
MRGNITRRGKSSWRLKFDTDTVSGERVTRYQTVKGKRADARRSSRGCSMMPTEER